MGLTREERKLLHHKAKQPTFGDGEPQQTQGYDGDITFRKVEGSGTVEYVKEKGHWKAVASSGEMPTVKIYGGGGGSSSGSGGGVTDHYDLSGLSDDDHPQYLLVDAGTRELLADWDAGSFDITAEQFHSDISIGTSPFTVVSTTEVALLNVAALSGADWDAPLDIGGTTPANAFFTDLDVDGVTTTDGITDSVTIAAQAIEAATTLDVDGATTLDQVTIDTSDGAFSVDGTNGTTINSTAGTLNIGNDADAFGINIGTGAAQRIITLGNATGTTALYHYAGTAGIGMGSQGEIQMDALGGLSKIRLDTDGGVIEIGVNDAAGNISIGTDATARTITIGNVTGATAVNLNAGTGGIALASTGAGDITINSDDTLLLDADGVLELNTSGGAINIGTDAVAVNTTLGNVTGATALALNAGTGGISLTSTGTGDVIINSDDTLLLDSDGTLDLNSSAGTIRIGHDAVAAKITIGGDVATRTEVELNAILIDINAGTGGAKINSTGVMQLDSDDTSNFRMDVNDAGNKTLSIRATNAGAGVGHLDIDADGDIDITAVGTLDLDSANGTWDATTLSIDSTDTTNISMNANDAADITFSMDAANAGAGFGKFDLDADIITYNTPYVTTHDHLQSNEYGSTNFGSAGDLSIYSTATHTWLNAIDNHLWLYSSADIHIVADGNEIQFSNLSTKIPIFYKFNMDSSPTLTITGPGANGANFRMTTVGTSSDILLQPGGGNVYLEASGGANTFNFDTDDAKLVITNANDNTKDPKISFTDSDSATGDFELDKNGNGRFEGDLHIEGNDLEFGNGATIVNTSGSLLDVTESSTRFSGDVTITGNDLHFGLTQHLNANLTQRLEIENTKYGVHINEPWAYADAPIGVHWYDSWNVRTQLGIEDGDPLSQHLSGGYADFYNNYFIVGCFYEQAGACVDVGKLYT